MIDPPLVSLTTYGEFLPLFFHPFTRRLRKFSSIYKRIIKLFIHAHESYQLCWISFMEKGPHPLVAPLSINAI